MVRCGGRTVGRETIGATINIVYTTYFAVPDMVQRAYRDLRS
jgi:hypothetical protein